MHACMHALIIPTLGALLIALFKLYFGLGLMVDRIMYAILSNDLCKSTLLCVSKDYSGYPRGDAYWTQYHDEKEKQANGMLPCAALIVGNEIRSSVIL